MINMGKHMENTWKNHGNTIVGSVLTPRFHAKKRWFPQIFHLARRGRRVGMPSTDFLGLLGISTGNHEFFPWNVKKTHGFR
jgi:hypothetical protein